MRLGRIVPFVLIFMILGFYALGELLGSLIGLGFSGFFSQFGGFLPHMALVALAAILFAIAISFVANGRTFLELGRTTWLKVIPIIGGTLFIVSVFSGIYGWYWILNPVKSAFGLNGANYEVFTRQSPWWEHRVTPPQKPEHPVITQSPDSKPATTQPSNDEAAHVAASIAWAQIKGDQLLDVEVSDCNGKRINLRSYLGKPLLIHSVALTSPGSLALGSRDYVGPLDGFTPQEGCASLEEWMNQAAGIRITDDRLTIVHLILSGKGGRVPPLVADGQRWKQHFRLDRFPNHVVLVADERFTVSIGLTLYDKSGAVLADWIQPTYRDDLQKVFMPALRRVVSQ